MIVRFEAADVLDRCSSKRIDVLVVISYGEEAQPAVWVIQRPAGDRGDQLVLQPTNVLVFVDKYPAIATSQRLALRLGFIGFQTISPQQCGGLTKHGIEVDRSDPVGSCSEARPNDAHRQRMARQDGDGSGLLADQIDETRPYFVRCMPVVGERQNAGGVLPADTDK